MRTEQILLLFSGLLFSFLGIALARMSKQLPALIFVLRIGCVLALAVYLLQLGYYLHWLDHAWYYEWRSWQLTDYLGTAIGYSIGYGADAVFSYLGLRRAAWFFSSLISALAIVLLNAKPWLVPLDIAAIKETRWREGVCLQSTGATCGPCSLATLLRAANIQRSEHDLAERAQTARSGTLAWKLARVIRDEGFSAHFVESGAPEEVRPPALLGVTLKNGIGHFVAYLQQNSGRYLIADPLSGKEWLSLDEFRQRYASGAVSLEIGLPER